MVESELGTRHERPHQFVDRLAAVRRHFQRVGHVRALVGGGPAREHDECDGPLLDLQLQNECPDAYDRLLSAQVARMKSPTK